MDQPQNQKRGCFFYGCLSLVILFAIVVVAGYLGYRSIKRTVLNYTDTSPAQIERAELPDEQQAALDQRAAAFFEALERGTNAQELVLTSAEINALIAKNKDFAGKVFVAIDSNRVTGKISVPLPDIGPFKLKGRYLNGEATLKVSLENSVLIVTLDEVRVKGKPLPASLMAGLKSQNLAADVQRDPEVADNLQKFESIEIRDNAVILRNRVNR